MLAFRSSLARLMVATAVLAVGFVTLRTQSNFWLGVLVTLAGLTALQAAGEVIDAEVPARRASRGAFLVVLGAGIGYGFGPWSDADLRGTRPQNPLFLPRYDRQIMRTTAALARLADHLGLDDRAAIYFVRWGSLDPPFVLVAEPGGRGSTRDLAAQWLSSGPSIHFFSSLRVYFDACYLLISLALATLVGLVVAGLARPGRDDPTRPAAP